MLESSAFHDVGKKTKSSVGCPARINTPPAVGRFDKPVNLRVVKSCLRTVVPDSHKCIGTGTFDWRIYTKERFCKAVRPLAFGKYEGQRR